MSYQSSLIDLVLLRLRLNLKLTLSANRNRGLEVFVKKTLYTPLLRAAFDIQHFWVYCGSINPIPHSRTQQ